jgi:pimeloyl-ACP methyl ester carboxylesterase
MLVHGNSMSARSFARQLRDPIGDELRLVAIDLPGHGESERPADPSATYTVPGLASIVVEVARALSIDDGVFVGWSLGGHLVLEAAPRLSRARGFWIFGTPPLRYPPNIEQAFLPHPALGLLFQRDLSDDECNTLASQLVAPGRAIPSEFVDDIRRTDPDVRSSILASLGAVGFQDETEIVARLSQPLAVFHGEQDALVNAGYIEGLDVPTLWRGSVQHILRAGHAAQWDAPETFDELLSAFVRDVAG